MGSRDIEQDLTDRSRYGYEELRAKRRLEAANRVEELAAIAKQVALDLRGPLTQSDPAQWLAANDTAYARVYWLRRELGRVVATLGVGLPDRVSQHVVEREYGEEAGWNSSLSPE